MESITHGLREGPPRIIFNGRITGRATTNRKPPPRGNVPSAAIGKIHYPEIHTSPDRNFASHILLALPGRFSRFRKQGVWRPCLKVLRCKLFSVRARKTQLTSKFSRSILQGGGSPKRKPRC